jgi:RecB family exonuclease
MEISFTRLRIYLECPWKYRLIFIEGKRIAPKPESSLGLSLHGALERFHRNGGESLEDLESAWKEAFRGEGYPDEKTRRQWWEKGRRILGRYFEQEGSHKSEILGLEREFLYPLGRHTVRGMIDRIDRRPDGGVEIIDYKTQFSLGPNDPLPHPPGENLQLRFYALGARESLALEPAWLTVLYLAAGRRESSPYDHSGEEELKAAIARAADGIEKSDWAPDTKFCPRCDFRTDCRFSTTN